MKKKIITACCFFGIIAIAFSIVYIENARHRDTYIEVKPDSSYIELSDSIKIDMKNKFAFFEMIKTADSLTLANKTSKKDKIIKLGCIGNNLIEYHYIYVNDSSRINFVMVTDTITKRRTLLDSNGNLIKYINIHFVTVTHLSLY
jgi:hypothetical protein